MSPLDTAPDPLRPADLERRIAELEAENESLRAIADEWFPWDWTKDYRSLDVDKFDLWQADHRFLTAQ